MSYRFQFKTLDDHMLNPIQERLHFSSLRITSFTVPKIGADDTALFRYLGMLALSQTLYLCLGFLPIPSFSENFFVVQIADLRDHCKIIR